MNDKPDAQIMSIGNSGIIQFKKTTLRFLEGRPILRHEWAEDCFIYQSFQKEESAFGDLILCPHTTFLADGGEGVSVEWEPSYGPLQKWIECKEDWEGEDSFGKPAKARKHWHYPFVQGSVFDWSQLAVEREGLKPMLFAGDIDGVFEVLRRWTTN